MVSPSAGALESVNQFLCQVAFGSGQEFPYWGLDTGRWALAHWTLKRQEELENLPPEGFILDWRVGDTIAHIRIKPLPDNTGLWCELRKNDDNEEG